MKLVYDATLVEKEFIPNFFKGYSTGRFLEIGANDGEPGAENEPCWPLVELGWSGVYCEPNPKACSALLNNLKPYKNILVYNGAVTVAGGLQSFYVSDEYPMASSFQENWLNNQFYVRPNSLSYPIITNTIRLDDLIKFTGSDFDCISIDIEYDEDVYNKIILDFDWTKFYKCKVIVLESITNISKEYFESIGFKLEGFSRYNAIFTR